MKKFVAASIALASAGALLMIGSSPALAAGPAIDPGDSLYAVGCDDGVYNDWQLLAVDSTSAVSTLIGDGSGATTSDLCARQPAWDPSTGTSYYIQWYYSEGDDPTYLATVDPATGDSVVIDEFFEMAGELKVTPFIQVLAIDGAGAAYAIDDIGYLYSVDLATAELTSIAPTGYEEVYSFAWDATTDEFYFIQHSGDIYALDVTTGFADFIDTYEGDVSTVGSLQFDQAGRWWVQVYAYDEALEESTAQLASFTVVGDTASAAVVAGTFTDDPYYTEALLIIPGEPALAATGADLGTVSLIAVGAGAIALAGAALLLRRRRTA